MKLKLTNNQVVATAKYLADVSKLIFAAAVLGFFIPIGEYPISITTFVVGILMTVAAFIFSIYLVK